MQLSYQKLDKIVLFIRKEWMRCYLIFIRMTFDKAEVCFRDITCFVAGNVKKPLSEKKYKRGVLFCKMSVSG